MPRAFPTQITGYLSKSFGHSAPTGFPATQGSIGKVLGFLELYDQLPPELIRLPEDDYASLIAAVATVRFGIDQYRVGNDAATLVPVGPALDTAWRQIAKLKDEVPSGAHDLTFIADSVLQEMIGLDISAIGADLQSGEWKGATILAGSCCEALLLYGLQSRETKAPGSVATAVAAAWPGSKAPDAADLAGRSWDLFSYTEAAHQLGLISRMTQCELGPTRDYRNLIHPAKTIRENIQCDQGTAFVAVGALEHVVSDLRRNL